LKAIHSVYRNRIHIKHGNLLLLWKLGFQDRMDRGERVSKFLSPIATKQSWNQESIYILYYFFFKLWAYKINKTSLSCYFVC
jgi:hypothetical protein